MSRAVRTVSRAPSNRRLSAVIGAAIGVSCLGLLLLALLTPARKQPSRTPPPSSAPVPDGRTAASAALRFAQDLAVAGVRHPTIYGARLRGIAAPGSESKIRAAFGKGAAEVRTLVGASGVLRAVPIGYRIDSLTRRTAAVSVWMVALAGGSRLEPTAQWRVLTLDLLWTSSGWRVTDGSGGSGPSPRSPLPLLVAEVSTFKELRHVP